MVQFGRAFRVLTLAVPNVPKIQGIFGNPVSQPGPNCTIQVAEGAWKYDRENAAAEEA